MSLRRHFGCPSMSLKKQKHHLSKWTGWRLEEFQVSMDPSIFIHNPKYTKKLCYPTKFDTHINNHFTKIIKNQIIISSTTKNLVRPRTKGKGNTWINEKLGITTMNIRFDLLSSLIYRSMTPLDLNHRNISRT